MDDRIELEITIDAPLERVWDLVTEPGWWVPTETPDPIDHTPGHRTVRTSEKWGAFTVEVVKVDPRTYAAFRWASQFPNEELAPGKTTLVEFFVRPDDDAVSVTVVESGFATLDADETVRKAGLESNTEGWAMEMNELKARAER
jgi:uncharacterized protein YndB with AHSA1/START domain